MGDQQHDDLAVGLAEVRAEVKALNKRFDSFGDLMDAKLAPLQKWMEGQVAVCSSHENRLTVLEGRYGDIAPTVQRYGDRLTRLEHVSANVVWVGTAAWSVVIIILGVVVRRAYGG